MLAKMRECVRLCAVSTSFFILAANSFAGEQTTPVAQVSKQKANKSLTICVTGSMCTACLIHLKDALTQIDGVTDVQITPPPPKKPSIKSEIHRQKRRALISLNIETDKASVPQIIESIRQKDFEVLFVRRHKQNKLKD